MFGGIGGNGCDRMDGRLGVDVCCELGVQRSACEVSILAWFTVFRIVPNRSNSRVCNGRTGVGARRPCNVRPDSTILI